jgi:hypothetical protein
MNAEEARKNTKMLADKLDCQPTMEAIYKRIGDSVLYDVTIPLWTMIGGQRTNEEKYSVLLQCITRLRGEGYIVSEAHGTYNYKISWCE